MLSRSLAAKRLIFHLKHFSNALCKKVIIIRSDNEFVTNAFIHYCDDAGIKHDMSVPYESHQNGFVKRWQRTITTKSRSMLASGNVSDQLRNEAVESAAYITSFTLRKYQNVVRTHYEIFAGRKASVAHLKFFGCAGYAMVPISFRQSKLADTSLLCCFAGYDELSKTYMV